MSLHFKNYSPFIMIRIIKTTQDYDNALARIAEIFDAEPHTPEYNELEVLSVLVEAYEHANYPIISHDPIEIIKQRMQDLHLKNKDIAPAM
jgi:HTH-type transcriptional regulator/antitoxin HigA